MIIPVHLLFISQIVFFVGRSVSHPARGNRRRQAESLQPKLTGNVIPVLAGDYDLPVLRLLQNKELLLPSKYDGQGNFIYIPDEAKHENEIPTLSALLNKQKHILPKDQRKQSTGEYQPFGHFQKNDINLLTNIIAKMSPEARNALVDALVKTLVDKSKTSATKINPNWNLDPALQPPVRVNKPDGPLVQPFSLTVEREKLRDLYKFLNAEKFRTGAKKPNVMVNLGDVLKDSMKTGKAEHKCSVTKAGSQCTTKSCVPESCSTEKTVDTQEEADVEECNCHYGEIVSTSGDFADKMVNLTQIFHVQPRLLIVNTGAVAPTNLAGILSETAKPSTKPCSSTLNCITRPGSRGPTGKSNMHGRKCTRRHMCKVGARRRSDRRGQANEQDLTYAYYMDMDDDLPTN